MTSIRDSVHGYIQLGEEELGLVDSQAFQRLRRVRQLGLTSLVYPSATHTRFQHSLGVMHLAERFGESLDLRDGEVEKVKLAALLHDTGHGPFSHASENVIEKHGLRHEDFSCEVIDRLEDRYSADASELRDIIRGESRLGQVVAGDVDADRMDYLIRDSQSSGLEHGKIDYETIIRLAEMRDGELVFDVKAVDALEALLSSRFHMRKTLYNHKTAVIAEKMLQRAIDRYISQGNSLEEFMRMDDYRADQALRRSGSEAVRTLYRRIRRRNLFKEALVLGEDKLGRKRLRELEKEVRQPKKLEAEIAEELGIEAYEVIVKPPETPELQQLDINVLKNGDMRPLSDFTSLPESLKEAEWRTAALRVYTPEKHVEDVGSVAGSVVESF
ncbi:MAG: HD domain-containing protein [Candidatus Nanohaloarchaea archaeon]